MDALDKIAKIQPEFDYKSDQLDARQILAASEGHKTYTTHYKMTRTQVTEVQQTHSLDDEASSKEHTIGENKKNKGCLARLFGRKKG